MPVNVPINVASTPISGAATGATTATLNIAMAATVCTAKVAARDGRAGPGDEDLSVITRIPSGAKTAASARRTYWAANASAVSTKVLVSSGLEI